MSNILEFKKLKTDKRINSLTLSDSGRFEYYSLYINGERIGELEKSDIRQFIEAMDYNDNGDTELLLNGSRFGEIPLERHRSLIAYLDSKIHK